MENIVYCEVEDPACRVYCKYEEDLGRVIGEGVALESTISS